MITVVQSGDTGRGEEQNIRRLAASPLVTRIFMVGGGEGMPAVPKGEVVPGSTLAAGETLTRVLHKVRTGYVLFLKEGKGIELGSRSLERLVEIGRLTGAGIRRRL